MRGHRVATVFVALLVVCAGCVALPPQDDAASEETPAIDEYDPTPSGEDETPAADDPEELEAAAPNGTLEVHVINLGQADSTLVVGPTGETMLIDTGDWRNDGETVIRYLESQGIERLDYLVSTHAHADHIGGHAAVIEHFETDGDGVGAVYDSGVPSTSATYERYLDAVEEHDVTLYEVRAGDDIPFEGVDVTVLNPPEDGATGDDLHDNSVSVHLGFDETSFVFTGDAENAAERRMVDEAGDSLAATGYHAGHHGSDTSSTPEFLDAMDPRIALISSAYESQYGHPHEEALERFAERGIETYWTAVHGTIVVESDGESIAVSTQTDATTDPTALFDASESSDDPAGAVEQRATYALAAAPAAASLAVPRDSPATPQAPLAASDGVGSEAALAAGAN
ncbi:ComEC/Rec2 family competence protein [Haloferacaceae archaeon DSL9]